MSQADFSSENVLDSEEDDKVNLYGSFGDFANQKGPKIRPKDIVNFPDGTYMTTTGERSEVPPIRENLDADIPLQDFQFQGQGQSAPLLKKDELKYTNYPSLHGARSNQSLTTWSSETIVSTRSFASYDNWLRHPKVRENWRVVLGSIALTIIGTVLLVSGLGILISSNRGFHCLVFFIIGLICFIPGVYHLVVICFAVHGRPGYSFYNIPTFK